MEIYNKKRESKERILLHELIKKKTRVQKCMIDLMRYHPSVKISPEWFKLKEFLMDNKYIKVAEYDLTRLKRNIKEKKLEEFVMNFITQPIRLDYCKRTYKYFMFINRLSNYLTDHRDTIMYTTESGTLKLGEILEYGFQRENRLFPDYEIGENYANPIWAPAKVLLDLNRILYINFWDHVEKAWMDLCKQLLARYDRPDRLQRSSWTEHKGDPQDNDDYDDFIY